jgi:hypothetical protein
MSKVSITGNASGSGTFTIAAPNSNSDRTLNLPDSAGTLLNDASSLAAANLTGTIPGARLPAGSVLQVVVNTSTTRLQTNSSSFVATNLSASITPTSATSKILIITSQYGNTEASTREIYVTLYRNSTNLASSEGMGNLYSSGSRIHGSISIAYLDSPNTTSSVTYTPYVRSVTGATIEVPSTTTSTHSIILMEIAA